LSDETNPGSQVTRAENFVKYGCVVFEICERTDKQTDRHTDTLIATLLTTTGGKAKKQFSKFVVNTFH